MSINAAQPTSPQEALEFSKLEIGLSNNALLTVYAYNEYSNSREECEMWIEKTAVMVEKGMALKKRI